METGTRRRTAHAAALACLLTLSAGPALAAGFDRVDQPFDLLFMPGSYLELSGNLHMPLRRQTNVVATHPITGQPLGGGNGGTFTESFFTPGFAVKVELAPWAACQLGLTSPWGGFARYDREWAGRYLLRGGSVETYDVGVTCRASLNSGGHRYSLLAGARWEWLGSSEERALATGLPPSPDGAVRSRGSSEAGGWSLGVAYEYRPWGIRASAMYHSGVDHAIFGAQTISVPGGGFSRSVDWGFPMPASLDLHVQSGFAPGWLAFASARWVQWSVLDTVTVHQYGTGMPIGQQRLGYHDTWSFLLGVVRVLSPRARG